MKKTITFSLALVLTLSVSFGQDSLRIAREISRAYVIRSSNPDSSLIYAENILQWAAKNENKYQVGCGYKLKGTYYYLKSIPDSALMYFNRAMELFQQVNAEQDQQSVNINFGATYLMIGNFDLALEYQLEAYEYFNKTGNQRLLGYAMRSISQIYSLTGDHAKALPFFIKVYELCKKSGDSINLAHAVSDLGSVYTYLKDYEKARKYKLDAIDRYTRNNDIPALGGCWQTLGNIDKEQGNFQLAQTHYLKAIDCYKASDYRIGFAQTYYNLGCLEDTLDRPLAAIPYYLKSIKAGNEAGDDLIPSYARRRLAGAYALTGNFKEAYQNHVGFYESSSKIMNFEKQKAIAEMETKFQTLQKDKEIEEQKTQIALQEYKLLRNRQYLFASLSLSAIFILMFFVWRSRAKIKELKLQEAHGNEIQQQRMMAIIDSQEKERKRFTSDLHDSFGQLISILKININELAASSVNPSVSKLEKFQECKSVINDMYQELRNVVFDLMPQTLVNGGIRPALEEFAERINRSGRMVLKVLFFELESRLPQETEVAVYRICQEWVNNILKYSDAQKITIQLTADEDEITLTIEDDGTGFDRQLLTSGKGNGWKNINSRGSLIGGKIELETTAGKKGSLLILNFPQLKSVTGEQKIPA